MAVVGSMLSSILDVTEEARLQDKTIIDGLCKAASFEAQLKSFFAMAKIEAPLSKDELLRSE